MPAWLFQATPGQFKVEEYLYEVRNARADELWWRVSRLGVQMAQGDPVFIWRATGRQSRPVRKPGVVARASLTRLVTGEVPGWVSSHWPAPPAQERIAMGTWAILGLQHADYTDRGPLVDEQQCRQSPVLASLPLFRQRQGTNFALTAEQASALDALLASRNGGA